MTDSMLEILRRSGKTEEAYNTLVSQLIRERYTLDGELAILRQRETKPEEFEAYNTYAEECKERAREETSFSPSSD